MKLFKQNREVVFVFGAGTSYSCGIPMQSKLVELIILNDDKYLK